MKRRAKFPKRTIRLCGDLQRQTLLTLIPTLPLDAERPLEVIIREEQRARKLDHNAAMWAGPLKDIAEQAYVQGRTFSAEVWHFHFKTLYLPEEYDEELTVEGYQKWDYTPSGERVLIGSTSQLTAKGMAQYITQIEADGASMGVVFHANPNDYGMR